MLAIACRSGAGGVLAVALGGRRGATPDGRVSAVVAQQSLQHQGTPKSAVVGKTGVTSLDLNPPKGTRDFYPDDLQFRSWLFNKWHRVASAFGYESYDAPVLEQEALYVAKSGEEIRAQLFNFEDKGGRRVALRPEMTPSLARMVLARRGALAPSMPLRWTTTAQCWRYEKTTRGRRREHYQWNMDVWGQAGVEAEAELLAALVAALRSMGLGPADVGIRVSSRRLLGCVFACAGLPEAVFAPACVLIDKMDKTPPAKVRDGLVALVLQSQSQHGQAEAEPGANAACEGTGDDSMSESEAARRVDELLSCLTVRSLPQLRTRLAGMLERRDGCSSRSRASTATLTDACAGPREHSQILDDGFRDCEQLWSLLGPDGYDIEPGVSNSAGAIGGWLEFDPSIVRGLAYYTGVVFEAFDRGGTLRAICGGGRYDALASALLGTDLGPTGAAAAEVGIPAVGFGFGDAVIHELLQAKGLLPVLPPARALAADTVVWSPGGNFACPESGPQLSLLRARSLCIARLLRRPLLEGQDQGCGDPRRGVECAVGADVPAGDAGSRSQSDSSADVATGQSRQLKAALKRASRNGSRVAVLCTARDLQESNCFVVRHLHGRSQQLCSYDLLERPDEFDAVFRAFAGSV